MDNETFPDKLPETIRDLQILDKKLRAYLDNMTAKIQAAPSREEKKALSVEGRPKYLLFKAVLAKIAATADEPTQHSQGDVSTETDAAADEFTQYTDANDWKSSVNEIRDTNPDMVVPSTPVVNPPWINSKVAPKPFSGSSFKSSVVIRFVADGKVNCFGHLSRPSGASVVKVVETKKAGRTEPPYFGIQVLFPCDKSNNTGFHFHNNNYHTVMLRFLPHTFTVVDGLVTDKAEFEEFLKDAPEDVVEKAKEGFAQKKLYRITWTFEDQAIKLDSYPHVYSSSDPAVQDKFNAMANIPVCKTLSVFLLEYEDLPNHLQLLYKRQQDHISPLTNYLHKHNKGLAA